MRRRRTIYFNDARHYYLFVFEPPMTLADAQVPVDEAAGTGVDTFIYGVARADGLYYPTKVGVQFGSDMVGQFGQAAYWRVWHNMKSLTDRGLNPLTVLIDRAHDKGMEFIASLRMGSYGGMDPAHRIEKTGGGLAHQEVRDHQFLELQELATDYDTDGVELDFALPGGHPKMLRPQDVEATTPKLTEYVKQVSQMVRGRSRKRQGKQPVVGVRVLPTEEMNLAQGFDVRAWLADGSVDYVAPLRYAYMLLDPDMPIDWLIEAATAADASVYTMLHPFNRAENVGDNVRDWATLEQMRAAAANYFARGADGMYLWFLHWPLGDTERNILTEVADPDLLTEADKNYTLARNVVEDQDTHYARHLPVEIASSDIGTRHKIPFYLADDFHGAAQRIRQVRLRIKVQDLTSHDRVTILLNSQSLQDETCLRDYHSNISPYNGQWLEFHLQNVMPRQGDNVLEIALEARAHGLISPLRVSEVEMHVEYGPYPSRLKPMQLA